MYLAEYLAGALVGLCIANVILANTAAKVERAKKNPKWGEWH